jgi:hypothetical protein
LKSDPKASKISGHVFVFEVSILSLFMIFLLDFRTVPTVWFFLLDFKTVPTVWYFLFILLTNLISKIKY